MFRYSPLKSIVSVVMCASLATSLSTALTAYAVDDDGSRAAASDAAKDDQPENQLATPTVPVESEKGTAVSDKVEQRQNAEALKRRAGEKIGGDPRGQALTLGMKLQEGNSGFVKVVEVAAASPAFDAGIRDGDVILSYHGFSADTYRKWIDGINRLTTEAQTGARIPVVVEREGKRMSLALRVPERPVRTPSSVALAQKANQLAPGAAGPAVSIPSGSTLPPRGGGGGSNVLIDNSGALGDFFGDQAASPNEGAIAHIFRLGGVPPTSPAGTGAAVNSVTGTTAASGEPGVTPQPTVGTAVATPPGSGPRIGMAGFRDDPSGMVVMVDVGALAPGNYVVGIVDSSVGGIAAPGIVTPNPGIQAPLPPRAPQGQLPAPGNDRRVRPENAPIAPPADPAQPQPAPAGALQQQGSAPPTSLIPRTVLAQVSDSGQPSGSTNSPADRSGAAKSGRSGPLVPASARPGIGQNRTAPAAGQAKRATDPNQTDAPGTGTTTTGAGTTPAGTGAATASGGSGSTLNDIGTLTVDQSGTGRMQQTVEGVQVRNVVGQSIVIYSMGGSPQTTLPPNLNPGAGAANRNPAGASPQREAVPVTSKSGEPGIVVPQGPATPQAAHAGQGQASTVQRVPVAAGVIRLISDRRPPPTGTETTDAAAGTATEVNPGIEQPATATPGTGQNQLR